MRNRPNQACIGSRRGGCNHQALLGKTRRSVTIEMKMILRHWSEDLGGCPQKLEMKTANSTAASKGKDITSEITELCHDRHTPHSSRFVSSPQGIQRKPCLCIEFLESAKLSWYSFRRPGVLAD